MAPVPIGFPFFGATMALKARSVNVARRSYMALAAAQVGGKVFYFQTGDEIVFVGEIANGPKQPGRHDFRLRLNSQLGFPSRPIRVLDVEFGILSVSILPQKPYRQLRTTPFAAGTIQQVF
jgi:hypothetical protein